ncbi:MAG: GTP-binding protein [Caldisericales bacterium]|nr:GTP-binding protein [Caldisericales bacterium]
MTKLKILVTGPFSSGKTTFINALSDIITVQTEEKVWGEDAKIKQTTTVGLDFGRIQVDDDVQIYLFGTPGQDRFDFIWEDMVKGSHGVIILLDRSDWRSVMQTKKFVDFYASRTSVPMVVVANKSDLKDILPVEFIHAYIDADPSVGFVEAAGKNRNSARKVLEEVLTRILA